MKPLFLVLFLRIWLLQCTEAFPTCGSSEYWSGNFCCLNCPAGTRMISACTTAGTRGSCVECNDGTYTEHSNGLQHCLPCTQCHSEKEIARPCTHTQDAECRCKPGWFCTPDQACEVCKRCSRCAEDEETVRNCTPTANTQCKKIQPTSVPASGLTPKVHTPEKKQTNATSIVLICVLVAAVIIIVVIVIWRLCRAAASRRDRHDGLNAGQDFTESGNGETRKPSFLSRFLPRPLVRAKPSAGVEDERKVLCESLSSSASNSQHSLTGLCSSAFPASAPRAGPAAPQAGPAASRAGPAAPQAGPAASRAGPMAPRQPNRREDVCDFPKLVPANGEESLRKCFEYFEAVDYSQHKKFFRHLGIVDNVIKSKESLPYDDKIHDLLGVWMEQRGREANLNELLDALLELGQRLTAETIKDKAILNGHYSIED